MRALLLHFVLLLAAAVAMTPFIWLISAAFRPEAQIYSTLPWQHLHELTLANFTTLLRQQPMLRWLVNSLFLASAQTVAAVVVSSMAGFALAKYRFPGRRAIMLILLGTLLLPGQVLLPGIYELMSRLGWVDSYRAILCPGAISVLGIFLFRQAMGDVPDELLHSARLDGCGELRLWWDIALPIVRPMIGAYTLLSFIAVWNGFLWPQIILQSESKYTLPMALNSLMELPQYQQQAGLMMAATLISIAPVALLFFALQRDFISGLSSGTH